MPQLTVLAILAILTGLFALLAAMPVDLDFQYDSLRKPRFRCRVKWLFCFVNIRLPAKKRRRVKRKKDKKKEKFRKVSLYRILSKALFSQCLDLVKKIWQSIHCIRFKAEIKAGLGEPADTGELFGAYSAAIPFSGMSDDLQVLWTPDFGQEPVLEGKSEGLIRCRPITVITAAAGFAFSRPVLKAVKRGFSQWRNRK